MDAINDLYNSSQLDKAFLNYAGGDQHLAEEIKSEVFIILLEKPDYAERHITAGTLEFAAKRIAKNLFNPTNKFFQSVIKPRRTDLEIDEAITMEDDFYVRKRDALQTELKKLTYFEQQLIKMLLKHGNAKTIADKSGFDYSYVNKTLKSGKRKLKKLINKKLY